MKKTLISLLVLSTILAPLSPSVAMAADPDPNMDPNVDGNLSLVRCIKKGNIDFGIFWDAVIYNDSFWEGIVEPWKDVIYRNQCQALDVIALVNQQDGLRNRIRDAFLTCRSEDLPDLKRRFHELTAEIFYVRHIVEGLSLSLPFDVLSTRQIAKTTIKTRDKLYNEMYNQYVKKGKFFTSGELDSLFIEFENKYADSIWDTEEEKPGPYIICDRGSWQEVTEKWQEFKEFFTEDLGGLRDAGESLEARGRAVAQEFEQIDITKLIKNKESFGDYLASFVEVGINNVAAKQGFEEIADKFSKNLPSMSVPTQGQLISGITSEAKRVEIDTMIADMSANFYVQYKDASDGTVKTFLEELDKFINTIEEGANLAKKIAKLAKKVIDRQCAN